MIAPNLSVELPVGADAWINGEHVVAVRDASNLPNCARCVFETDICPALLYCMDSVRKDHENVHFERVFKR